MRAPPATAQQRGGQIGLGIVTPTGANASASISAVTIEKTGKTL